MEVDKTFKSCLRRCKVKNPWLFDSSFFLSVGFLGIDWLGVLDETQN